MRKLSPCGCGMMRPFRWEVSRCVAGFAFAWLAFAWLSMGPLAAQSPRYLHPVDQREADPEPGTLWIGFRLHMVSQSPLVIGADTNLPDGAKISFLLRVMPTRSGTMPACSPHCFWGAKLEVHDGHFQTGPIVIDGRPPVPDRYAIEMHVFPGSQPREIMLKMGEKGQLLRGPHVRAVVDHQERRVTFPWIPDPNSEEFTAGLALSYSQWLTIGAGETAALGDELDYPR